MLTVGDLLQGRYRILQRLGQGGMATIYLAADTRLGDRRMAVKEMSAAHLPPSDQAWAVTAFRREAQVLAHLDHPRLADVTDFFAEGGRWLLVMEYVPGETMAEALARTGRFSEAQVLAWARQLGGVLHYLHTQNPPVIFRDLKPSNVMIRPDGSLKLIDFGIARLFKPGQTRDTVRMGTPGYAAPEQYGRGQTDARSDVYSLGVLLHQLLTGYDPARTPVHLPPVQQLAPAVSLHVAQAIEQALHRDPARRFQSVTAFMEALGAAPVAPAAAPAKPRMPRWLAGVMVAGVGVALVAAIMVGVARLGEEGGATPDTGMAIVPSPSPPPTLVPSSTRPGRDTSSSITAAATTTRLPTHTPTSVPSSTPTASPTPSPTATSTSPPTQTPARSVSASQIEAAYLQSLPERRLNEPAVFAYEVTGEIRVDGRIDDAGWRGERYPVAALTHGDEQWEGEDDLAGEMQVGWDDDYLYLAVTVQDDLFVQTRTGRNLYLGDSVEVQFDADLAGDFDDDDFDEDDLQLGISPGDFVTLPPEMFLWLPRSQESSVAAPVAARSIGQGYVLEAAVPWDVLDAVPRDRAGFGFTLCVSDNDRPGESVQETLLCVHASREWAVATSLGTLVLVGQ